MTEARHNRSADQHLTRRQLSNEIKQSLREMSNQIALLNHQVCARVDLRDVDLECFDLISQRGPLSPSAIARQAALHPATVTGILDRLQRRGWVDRGADPADRRGTLVRARPERNAELFGHYASMNTAMDVLLASYHAADLAVIGDFLGRASAAAVDATTELADQRQGRPGG